jgi:hypothetical protein
MKFHRNPGLHNLETCFITMKISNFEALEVTAMYFTFSETSHLPLFGQGRSRSLLYDQYL